MFILAATEHFSKWAEAISLREVGAKQVTDFIRTPLIYRYGVPYNIISDNAIYFKNQVMIRLAKKISSDIASRRAIVHHQMAKPKYLIKCFVRS